MKEGVSQIERQQDPVNPGIGIRDVPEKPTRDLFGINLQDEDRRPFLKSVIVMGLNLVVIVVTVVLLGKVPGLERGPKKRGPISFGIARRLTMMYWELRSKQEIRKLLRLKVRLRQSRDLLIL